jgi:dolichol-phosphate mannosyltransferase
MDFGLPLFGLSRLWKLAIDLPRAHVLVSFRKALLNPIANDPAICLGHVRFSGRQSESKEVTPQYMDKFKVSVVIPSYNEEKNVQVLAEKLQILLERYSDYEIIYVDDGSKDRTLEQLKELHKQNPRIEYISFSRNFGHQNALRAGLDHAGGDCVVCLDADMQHPPELIPRLIAKWQEGCDIVYTVRQDSKQTSMFKRSTASFFYFLINRLANTDIRAGAADYRLMDRKVVQTLREYGEKFIFYRGVIATIGFNQTHVEYVPEKRLYGKSKYNIGKMVMLAIDGITAFSTVPLRFSSILGMIISFFAFAYTVFALLVRLLGGYTVAGWSSLTVGVFFLGGIQLIMIGILGEYIGKLFLEVKKRPNYIIKQSSIQ